MAKKKAPAKKATRKKAAVKKASRKKATGKKAASASIKSAPTGSVLENAIGMHFVKIPEGQCTVGSGEDRDGDHLSEAFGTVRVDDAFYLGIVPVTEQQFSHVMGRTPQETPVC